VEKVLNDYESLIANTIIGIDTIWGGDVNNPSGIGRFIADCYFSGKDLPEAYTDPMAQEMRKTGALGAKEIDKDQIQKYIKKFELPDCLRDIRWKAAEFEPLRSSMLKGVADCMQIMLDLAFEVLGKGYPVPYERCVEGSCGISPHFSDPAPLVERVESILGRQGYAVGKEKNATLVAVDAWRKAQRVTKESLKSQSAQLIAKLDKLTEQNVLPFLPKEFREVPRTNIQFLPIENAWFSGSMNYLGRERTPEGRPLYEATYEINADLEIAIPEFEHLIGHEVVPGHVMTFALIQNMYYRDVLGFESTVLAMNTRASTLHEGIANASLLLAYAIDSDDALPEDLHLGVLFGQLQDAAKNNASYLTYAEKQDADKIAASLRTDCLVSEERANKLAKAWAKHPIMGRMYMPCYEAGTKLVVSLIRKYGREKVIPVLYWVNGPVDVVTIKEILPL
jgi:hypothetical protein